MNRPCRPGPEAAIGRRLRPGLGVLLALLGLVVGPGAGLAQAQSRGKGIASIEFLDIGQGDAVLVRSPEGKTALIDAGLDKSVVDRLRERGVDEIDLVVVTHHHTDHYGGMDDVIKAIRPRYFLASNSGHTTSMYLKLLDLVKQEKIFVIAPTSKPRKLLLGSVSLTVLPQPPQSEANDENNNSIGIRVDYGSISALLTGDSEESERKWWETNCPDLLRDCTILKLAHHGSRNGTNQSWLDIVRPEIAVASLGAGNDYGHPHSETLKLLERNDLPLLRTDQKGTIVIRTDGRRWQVDSKSMARRGSSRDKQVATASAGSGSGSTRTASARSGDTYDATGKSSPSSKGSSKSGSGDTWSSKSKPTSSGLVNVNKASQSELERLPGIGPTTAGRIIENRPYRSIGDLRSVPGLSSSKLAQIEDLIDVR